MKDIRGINQQLYWSSRATTYGKQYGLDTAVTRKKIQRKVQLMAQYGGIDKVDKILEIGCGTGLFTREIFKINPNLVAADISLDMLEIAKKQCGAQFIQVDARKLAIENNTYDVVVSTYLLQHVDTDKVLTEMCRILKSKGKLVAIIPNILNPIHYGRARMEWLKKLVNETSSCEDFTRWQWVKILKHYGFEPIVIKPIEFVSPFIPDVLFNFSMKINQKMEIIPIIREFAGTLIIVAEKN